MLLVLLPLVGVVLSNSIRTDNGILPLIKLGTGGIWWIQSVSIVVVYLIPSLLLNVAV